MKTHFLKRPVAATRPESGVEALQRLGVEVETLAASYLGEHPGVTKAVIEMAQETQRSVRPIRMLLTVNHEPSDPYLVMTVRQNDYTATLPGSLSAIWESIADKTGLGDGWVVLTTDFKRASAA